MDKDVTAICAHKKPSTPKKIRSFLGLASYESKYVHMIAEDKKILCGCITDGKYLACNERAHQVLGNL
jgi:hypothetical protein